MSDAAVDCHITTCYIQIEGSQPGILRGYCILGIPERIHSSVTLSPTEHKALIEPSQVVLHSVMQTLDRVIVGLPTSKRVPDKCPPVLLHAVAEPDVFFIRYTAQYLSDAGQP